MRAQATTLWSTRYDRPIEDLFAMQDDIATQVAAALNDRISGMRAPEAAAAPTRDIEAYLAWLRGRTLTGRYTAAKADAAAAEFEQAIARDPGFAAAYVALYDARMQSAALRFEDTEAARRRYRPLLERALALDPDSGAVLFAQAMWEDLDDATRESIFREAVRRDPGNSRGLTSFAMFLNLISNREKRRQAARLRTLSRSTSVHRRRQTMPASCEAKPIARARRRDRSPFGVRPLLSER